MTDTPDKSGTRRTADFEERRFGDHTVRIDRTTCISTGNCTVFAPDAFALGDDDIVTFAPEVDKLDADKIIEACRICPVDALLVFDPSGKKIVPEY